jgi:hypothetical protein
MGFTCRLQAVRDVTADVAPRAENYCDHRQDLPNPYLAEKRDQLTV